MITYHHRVGESLRDTVHLRSSDKSELMK